MKLPEIAIKNHQFTIVIVMLLVLLGIVSILTMPYSEDPEVSPAGSSVIVIYPGASPKDIEQLVVDPIEEAIDELDDIKYLTSTARDGLGSVSVEFVSGSDPDKKYSDVVEKVNSIRNSLPDGINLNIWKWSVSDTNILQIAIVSDSANYSEMEEQAEKLRKRLVKSYGVKKADKWAFPKREVRVSLNLDKMSRMRISLNQVFYAIQNANMNIPGGNVDIDTQSFNIQTSGIYQSLEDIANTIISSDGKAIIYLKDIGNVDFDYKDEEHKARFNGSRAVFVTATQKEGTNIFNVFFTNIFNVI